MFNLFGNDEPGIHILQHRFHCSVDAEVNLHEDSKNFRSRMEMTLVVTLLSVILLFQLFKQYDIKEKVYDQTLAVLNVEEIPVTTQKMRAPAPSRPTVPIASEDEFLSEDETIDFTDLSFEDVPPPPPPLEEDSDLFVFVPYDEPPYPVGGFEAILKNLKYPEMGRLAGIEGEVIVALQIDVDGAVARTRMLESMGIDYFDEAAIAAVTSVEWKPAMQRDMPIKVWISVPLEFKLTQD